MKPTLYPLRTVAGALHQRLPLFIGWIASLCAVGIFRADAQTSASQDFNLIEGWNAIYLEVAPDDPDPDVVFGGGDIDQVSGYFPRLTSAQFTGSAPSGGEDFGKKGWLRWDQSPSAVPVQYAWKGSPSPGLSG